MLERVRNESLNDRAIQGMVRGTVYSLYKERSSQNSDENVQDNVRLSIEEEANYIDCVTNALKGSYIPGFFYITRIILNPNKYLNGGFDRTTKAEVRKNIVNCLDKIIRENIQHVDNLRHWNPEEIISYLQYMPDNSDPAPDRAFRLPECNMSDNDLGKLRSLLNVGDQGELNSLFREFSFHYSKILNLLAQNDQIFRDLAQYGFLVEELMQPNIPYESIELLATHMDKIPTVLESLPIEDVKYKLRFSVHLNVIFDNINSIRDRNIIGLLSEYRIRIQDFIDYDIPPQSISVLILNDNQLLQFLNKFKREEVLTIVQAPKVFEYMLRNINDIQKINNSEFFEKIFENIKRIEEVISIKHTYPNGEQGEEIIKLSLLFKMHDDIELLEWSINRLYQFVALAKIFAQKDNNYIQVKIDDINVARDCNILPDKDLEYIPSSDAYLTILMHIITTHLYYYNGGKEEFESRLSKFEACADNYVKPYDKSFESNESVLFLGISIIAGIATIAVGVISLSKLGILLPPINIHKGLATGGVMAIGVATERGTFFGMQKDKDNYLPDNIEEERSQYSPVRLVRKLYHIYHALKNKIISIDDYGPLVKVSRFSDLRCIYKKNIIERLSSSLSFLTTHNSFFYLNKIMKIVFENRLPNYVSNKEILFIKYRFNPNIQENRTKELQFINQTLSIDDNDDLSITKASEDKQKEFFNKIKAALDNLRHMRSFLFAMFHGYMSIDHLPGVENFICKDIYPETPKEMEDSPEKRDAFMNACGILYCKLVKHHTNYISNICEEKMKHSNHLDGESEVDVIRRKIHNMTEEIVAYERIAKLDRNQNNFICRN